MKKIINIFLKMCLLAFLFLCLGLKAQINTPPTIDGKINDAVWNLVPWQNIKYNHTASIIKDSVDFDAKFKFLWDAKNFYVALKVSDDTLVSKPKFAWEKYNVDGAEIYFDLDNSKNILQPRNANYTKTSYDKNDFQYQLWLDKTAATAKLSALTGFKIDTVRTNGLITGYTMECKFSIDSLKANDPNFSKSLTTGSKIGFDVNMTDNDWNYKTEAYFRSELSWRSRSEQVYHDAVYMGTIQLNGNGTYTVADDVTPPSSVTASVIGGKLSWTKAQDNILAEKYYILRDGLPYDTVSRDTSLFVLSGGKFTVKAVDLYDNVSAPSNEITIQDGITIDGNLDPAYDVIAWEPIKTNIFNKTIKDSTDFYAKFKFLWDPKFFYLYIDVTDDSIVVKPKFAWEKYMVDNTEVYFDLDNSKNILMPRNANYTKTAFDKNDIQFQLWPDGSTQATAKKSALMDYVVKPRTGGYVMECKFSVDSLKSNDPDFSKPIGEGSVIGFDINVSDNDWGYKGEEYYRNETTWNATSENVYHDPIYMGAIKLAANNKWTSMRDVTPPDKITGLVAKVSNDSVYLSWNTAVDNILAENYIVLQNGNKVDTLLRETNTAIKLPLTAGVSKTFDFQIQAVDINGNIGVTTDKVSVTLTEVRENSISHLTMSPNPAKNSLRITSSDNLDQAKFVDISGRIVKITKLTGNSNVIDLSSLNSSIYFVHVKSIDGKSSVMKLTVK